MYPNRVRRSVQQNTGVKNADMRGLKNGRRSYGTLLRGSWRIGCVYLARSGITLLVFQPPMLQLEEFRIQCFRAFNWQLSEEWFGIRLWASPAALRHQGLFRGSVRK